MIQLSEICLKRYETSVLYLSFLSLGLCTAIPGPTLLDLQSLAQTDMGHISYIFLGRSSGYLIGSIAGGVIFDCLKKKKLLLLIFNLAISISVFAVPWCRDVYALVGVMAVSGAAMGALDTGGNVWCLDLWGEDSSPYFQALHFLFGLGAFVSPLIAEPFLMQRESDTHYMNNGSDPSSHQTANSSLNANLSFFKSLPPITFVYGIIGIFSFAVTFLFMIMLCISVKGSRVKVKNPVNNKDSNTFISVIVVLLSSILLCVYAGIEIGYGQMIASYAVKSNLSLSKAIGSLLTSVYWGSFTLSRGIAIILSAKLSPLTLLLADFTFMLFASIVLVLYGNSHVDTLWVGTAVLGISLASFYPSTITWIEQHVTVSNKIASSFVVAASLGEMIVPLTVSQFLDPHPQFLFYIVLSSVLICGLLILILYLILRRIGNSYVVKQTVPSESQANESSDILSQNNVDENSL